MQHTHTKRTERRTDTGDDCDGNQSAEEDTKNPNSKYEDNNVLHTSFRHDNRALTTHTHTNTTPSTSKIERRLFTQPTRTCTRA